MNTGKILQRKRSYGDGKKVAESLGKSDTLARRYALPTDGHYPTGKKSPIEILRERGLKHLIAEDAANRSTANALIGNLIIDFTRVRHEKKEISLAGAVIIATDSLTTILTILFQPERPKNERIMTVIEAAGALVDVVDYIENSEG